MTPQTTPSFDPNGLYLSALRVGRTCYDHAGRHLEILRHSEGSTEVHRIYMKGGKSTSDDIVMSNATVVYLSNPKKEHQT